MLLAPSFTLEDAQCAAVDAGYCFPGTDTHTPLPRRANLAAFLESLGVNSLSALRRKLRQQIEAGPEISLEKGSWPVAASAVEHSTEGGRAVLVLRSPGPASDGHGVDSSVVFRSLSGAAWSIYIGQGSGGLATGLGVMLTGAGDWYAGSWRDGAVWGRGLHVFSPPPAGGGGPSQAWRRDFAGSFDGRPFGLGRATWWDGRQEHGRFHGTQLVEQVGCDRVDEVVGSALQSARAACRHARRLWLRVDSEHAAFAAQCLAQAPDLPSALSRIDEYDMSE
ncbi:hypothetical protein ACKKBF_B34540 [Auxenochlorella protothecoides x Auxenochlorella symbiontica]